MVQVTTQLQEQKVPMHNDTNSKLLTISTIFPQHLPLTYSSDSVCRPCYKCWCMTPADSPPQLLSLIQTRRLNFFRHAARMGNMQDTFRALHMSSCGLPKDWKRRPGRPSHAWLWTIEANLQTQPWIEFSMETGRRLRQLVDAATLQSGADLRWWQRSHH